MTLTYDVQTFLLDKSNITDTVQKQVRNRQCNDAVSRISIADR